MNLDKIYSVAFIFGDVSVNMGDLIPTSISVDKWTLSRFWSGSIFFNIKSDVLNLLLNTLHAHPYNYVIMQGYIPIKVQTKIHKKHRINKKWLKRYGMRDDRILCTANCCFFDYTPNENETVDIECVIDRVIIHWYPYQKYHRCKIEI